MLIDENVTINWLDKSTRVWAEEHFQDMLLSGLWAPEGQGFIMQKNDVKELTLIRAVKHPFTLESLNGINNLLFELGYSYSEVGVLWDDIPNNNEETEAIVTSHEQTVVDSWKCECGIPLKEIDIKEVYPIFIESQQEVDGSNSEYWNYQLDCPCGKGIDIEPQDFQTMHGAKRLHMFSQPQKFGMPNTILRGLNRQEICDFAEEGKYTFIVLGKSQEGTKIPPWMWGVVAIDSAYEDENGIQSIW